MNPSNQIRNSKSEIRNKSKCQNSKAQNSFRSGSLFWIFFFDPLNLFRISYFVFRIWDFRSILARIGQAGGGEGPAALSAFIAMAAMPIGQGMNTGKGPVQGQLSSPLQHVSLGQPHVRPKYLDLASDRLIHDLLVGGEKLGSRIRKRVRFQHGQRHRRNLVEMAPQNRLGQEQNISPRQENGLLRGGRVWHLFAGDAPMVAIEVVHRQVEDLQRLQLRTAQNL